MVGNLFLGRRHARCVKSCWRDWSAMVTGKKSLGRGPSGGGLSGGSPSGEEIEG